MVFTHHPLRLAGILLGASFLSACAVQQTSSVDDMTADMSGWQAPLPEGVASGTDSSLVSWWQQFQDPQLNQLVQLTLSANPDMESARLSHRLAQVQAGVANADSWPQLTASAGVTNAETNSTDSTTYRAGLSASWELDIWGTGRSEKRAAAASVEQAVHELHAAQVSLIAQVAAAYVDLRQAQHNLAAAEQTIALRQQHYQLARNLYASGMSTELAVMQAKTVLEQARANKPQYQLAQTQALNELRALTANQLGALQLQQTAALPALPQQLVLALPAELLRQRPDVKAQEYALIAQGEAVTQAHNQRFPSFTLTGSLVGSDSNAGSIFDADNLVRTIAASLSYSLFDSGVLKTNEQTQQIKFEQALQSYHTSLLTAQQEVEDALAALASAQQQQQSYVQAESSAQMANRLAQMQYDAGMLDFDELLDAQSDLISARNSRVQNDGQLLSDWIQLYRVAGGGWQALNDVSNTIENTDQGDLRE